MSQSISEDAIRARVRSIVVQLAPVVGVQGSRESRLLEDLAYHSLAFLELGFALEDELGMPQLDRDVAMTIRTLGDLEDHVVRSTCPTA